MSISVYCQWCGAANNTAGRCTDMMCRGGDARPAVVEVGSDPVGDSYRTRMVKDWEPGGTIDQLRIEIAALRARVEQLTGCHAGPGTTTRACGACSTCWANVVERLETRVAALEAVERAAREYRAADLAGFGSTDTHEAQAAWERRWNAAADALDAALAALEVNRG